MKKIDKQTVQRILDTADIVEVVSDFVNLKKRGANWIGLCPFHNERTPSFSVSRAKGICKCFSCGKGGSPVNFIMEHEQLSYQDALRYLAKKYHIEIKEYEMTDQEREQASEREAMIAVNDFALQHFTSNIRNTSDGRDIGLAYFRHRGINDLMIDKFKLGYSLDHNDALYRAAIAAGYDEKFLIATGLCARSERTGSIYDRFRGRVIYPVFSVSGRVVAFGGRTLRNDKNIAKYVNSPESQIYHKSNELYGLYQAKSQIVKKDCCILVEGYMDVISMHQIGVENVIASSGTSLTDGQIRMIHRFTENVIVIYDSDAAGIKASLRGIDLLLAQGLNIKVVLLPDGDDPDSFAQSHSLAEVEAYLEQNATDFMQFKTRILLKDTNGDPVQRARVINNIVASIAVIPDPVVRSEYIKQCARMLDSDERVLTLQMQRIIADKADHPQQYNQNNTDTEPDNVPVTSTQANPQTVNTISTPLNPKMNTLEATLAKYIVRYGMLNLPAEDGSDDPEAATVLDFICQSLSVDNITLSNPVFRRILDMALDRANNDWTDAHAANISEVDAWQNQAILDGQQEIRDSAIDLADIQAREKILDERINAERRKRLDRFACSFLESYFLSCDDDDVRNIATKLSVDKYQLSKVHTKYSHIETEQERLGQLVPRAVLELKLAILDSRIDTLRASINDSASDPERLKSSMQQLFDLYQLRKEFAIILGDRIVTPK